MAKRVCARCRYSAAHHQKLDDAVVTQFIGKLTDMLASSSGKVVLPAVEALERLITGGQRKSSTKLRQENLSIIKERNGIERLLGLVSRRRPLAPVHVTTATNRLTRRCRPDRRS